MARTWGDRPSKALWAVLLFGLGGLGCQAQVSFLTGTPLAPPAPATATPAATAPAAGPASAARSASPGTLPAVLPPTKPSDLGAPQSAGTTATRAAPRYPAADSGKSQFVQSVYQVQDKSNPDKANGDKPNTDKTGPDLGPKSGMVVPPPPPTAAALATPEPEVGPRLPLPNEKAKTMLPAYVIEPPDVLLIDGVRLLPRPPYRIEPLDVLLIAVPNALPDQPIGGPYTVTPEGTVNLGFGYGNFHVAGMTLDQAAAAVKAGLRLNNPQVSVALAQFRGVQMVRGEHIVGQDGTITLGTYGCVNVTGLTLSQAKCEIERHLSRWLQDPVVSVSVAGYNSKVYYVIFDGGGFGQQVYRFPITGNETVLDGIAMINGLPPVSSKHKMWLARPTPAQHGCYEILPVNWEAITEAGATETNWQIFPGDRIYVKADPLITIDNQLAKILSPIERLFGATLLGSATVHSFNGNFNNNNNGFGF